jgi:hypothetical protein
MMLATPEAASKMNTLNVWWFHKPHRTIASTSKMSTFCSQNRITHGGFWRDLRSDAAELIPSIADVARSHYYLGIQLNTWWPEAACFCHHENEMIYHPVSQIELAKLLSSSQSKNLQGISDLHSQNHCLFRKFLHKVATHADTPWVHGVHQQY